MHPPLETVTHRIKCPSCGAFAQLRVANWYDADEREVHLGVATFSCINQNARGHVVPHDDQLLAAIPRQQPRALTTFHAGRR